MLQLGMKNKNEFIKHLKNTLHLDISIEHEHLEYQKSIPVAIKSKYEVFRIRIETFSLVVLHTQEEELQNIKKHLTLFKSAFLLPIVLSVSHITNSSKKYFIENAISFIADESIYLPHLLIYLKDIDKKKLHISNKKLSKLAQTILLYMIVQKRTELTINESKNLFHVTKMSTSRALNELVAFEFLNLHTEGRQNKYIFNDIFDTENTIKQLKSPVQTTVFINQRDISYFEKKAKASYNALSIYTNITNHKTIYAAEKLYFDAVIQKNPHISVYEKEYDNELIELELWRYSPLLIQERVVDKISLYLSLKDNVNIDDTRVMDAMSELYIDIKRMID